MYRIPHHMRTIDNGPGRNALSARIDFPRTNDRVYDQFIPIKGTLIAPPDIIGPLVIRAWIDRACIGQTRMLTRPAAQNAQFAFTILAKLPESISTSRAAIIAVTLLRPDDEEEEKLAEVSVQLVPASLRTRPYGDVVSPDQTNVLHRENIYGSGPPVEEPSPEALRVVLEYLSPHSSVVDVGCGAGAFAPGLMNAGHQWLGLELNESCIERLECRKLPYRKLADAHASFPCVDREFDHAVCIEVLEHVAEPGPFLREIARIIRGRALFSVPNMEALPYFHDWQVVPWHLLEASHLNFFTRASLRMLLEQHFREVEIASYGEHPLRTKDGVALHLHFFAVASS